MFTAFTSSLLQQIKQINKGVASVICESEDPKHFGNAHVTLDLDELRLHVICDRGISTVEVGLSVETPIGDHLHPALSEFKDGTGRPTCPLEVLAVTHGWITFDDLVEHYDLDGQRTESFKDSETITAPPFYELADALSLLADKEKWSGLVRSSKDHKVQMRAGTVEQELQERFAATLAK